MLLKALFLREKMKIAPMSGLIFFVWSKVLNIDFEGQFYPVEKIEILGREGERRDRLPRKHIDTDVGRSRGAGWQGRQFVKPGFECRPQGLKQQAHFDAMR